MACTSAAKVNFVHCLARIQHGRRDQRAALYFVPSREVEVRTRPKRVRAARGMTNGVDFAFSGCEASPQKRRERLQLKLWSVRVSAEARKRPG